MVCGDVCVVGNMMYMVQKICHALDMACVDISVVYNSKDKKKVFQNLKILPAYHRAGSVACL